MPIGLSGEIDKLIQDSGRGEAEFSRIAVTFGFSIFWKHCAIHKISFPERECTITETELRRSISKHGIELGIEKLFSDSSKGNKGDDKTIYEEHLDKLDQLDKLCEGKGNCVRYMSGIPIICHEIMKRIAFEELNRKYHKFLSLLFFLGKEHAANFFKDYEPSLLDKLGRRYQHIVPLEDLGKIFRKMEVSNNIDVDEVAVLLKNAIVDKGKSYFINKDTEVPITNGVHNFGEYSHLRKYFRLGV